MQVEYLLLGFALGVVPLTTLAGLFTAWLGKRLGVKPQEVQAYRNATAVDDDGLGGGEQSGGK